MAMLGDRQSVVIFVVEFSLLITFYLIYFSVQSIYLDKTKKIMGTDACRRTLQSISVLPHAQATFAIGIVSSGIFHICQEA